MKLFASLRETLGQATLELNASQASTVGEVWTQIAAGQPMPPNTLMAVNMEYVDAAHPVQAGDEVAFFPPVTGG